MPTARGTSVCSLYCSIQVDVLTLLYADPRWASWNLGIFICIRCSGIHRGMGTHISRVKSVDLDAWTDEQLQSVLKWGNSRANKYWEAKLAPGHVPSESKMENFIRTKYESKRWVMDGPIPDPSTLDVEGDDDVPLSLVKEKHSIERSASQRASQAPAGASSVKRVPQPDLIGGSDPVPRASSASIASGPRPPPKADAAPPKQTKPADSLLGLDFFGTEAPPPNRPASTASVPGQSGPSRPDLKQSILSLYASAPRPQPVQQPQHGHSGSFGGMQSPAAQPASQSAFGGLNDAFSSLSFASPTSAMAQPPAQKPASSAFSGLGDLSSMRSTSAKVASPTSNLNLGGGGGNFFNSSQATKPTPAPPAQTQRTFSSSSGFGAFDSAPGITPSAAPAQSNTSALGDLFDFSTPAVTQPSAPKQTIASPAPQTSSVFNLSQPSKATPAAPAATSTNAWSSNDAFSNAWSTPDPVPAAKPLASMPPAQTSAGGDFGAWGSLANTSIVPGSTGGFAQVQKPKVSNDEDFGGWSSAAVPAAPTAAGATKPATGFAGGEDLFSNVWE